MADLGFPLPETQAEMMERTLDEQRERIAALEAENEKLKKQMEWLVSVLHDISTHAGAVVRTAGGA